MGFFKDIIDQLDGAAITDRQGCFLYVNEGWERIMGYDFDSVKGRSALEIVPKTRCMEAMNTGIPILGVPINQAEGREMFSNYHPIKQNGEVVGCFTQIIFGNIDDAIQFSDKVARVERELSYYKNVFGKLGKEQLSPLDKIIGSSAAVKKMKERIVMAAKSHSTVLIIGETGSGKELIAYSIHNLSKRWNQAFIKINCAAIPNDLAESEFFGYEYGAFTGARKEGKEGLFELANKGTLFLDEINQMSFSIQPKLLRVFQEREVQRIGGKNAIPVDVRVITASNQPLESLVKDNTFRQDLYYRLNVVRINVPPLRERLEDIPELVSDIIERLNHQMGTRVEGITPEVCSYFQSYHWPGNIRELQNILEQAINTKGSGKLDIGCFDSDSAERTDRNLISNIRGGTLKKKNRELERMLIFDAYETFNHNKKRTAEFLGISRPLLYQRLKEYGII